MSLYEQMKAAGIPMDNHESDLYVLATPEARALVSRYRAADGRRARVSIFQSPLDGQPWLEVPFAFDPWWQARATARRACDRGHAMLGDSDKCHVCGSYRATAGKG
jgi:hypothetical protein